jgi:predicted metal-dependent phosphoesterase TrpH
MKAKWLVVLAVAVGIAANGCAAKKVAKAPAQKPVVKIEAPVSSKQVNPFDTEGKWYRANLHTHTSLSDGDVNLPVRVKEYRDKGYQVLAVTDHEKTNDVAGYSDKDFLLISGMETHPKSNQEENYHFVCLNIPRTLTFAKEVQAQDRINQVKAAGGEVIFAHPYWSGHNINDMLAVSGYIGVEVYNGEFWHTGKSYNMTQWDQVLNTGRIISGFANDDVHHSYAVGQSWTMIKAKELAPRTVMESLRTGCFYSTCGPVIEDFGVDANTVSVKCSPVVEICFMGQTKYSYNVKTDSGHLITAAEYQLPKEIKWVRAEIVDVNGKHAWTNPIEIKK